MHIKKQKLNSVQGFSNAGQLAEMGLFDLKWDLYCCNNWLVLSQKVITDNWFAEMVL